MPADYVTKQDLREGLRETEERLIEKMRDMQTEILRGFEVHVTAIHIRLRKLEIDHATLAS